MMPVSTSAGPLVAFIIAALTTGTLAAADTPPPLRPGESLADSLATWKLDAASRRSRRPRPVERGRAAATCCGSSPG